jgi:tetratricopeptide (TPR) repeat protein
MFFYRSKRTAIEYAVEMFSKAIDKDPNYALAYAGIADCYSYLFIYFDYRNTNLYHAREASRRAPELDSNLAEAHAAHGLALSLSKQHDEAETEFEAAIRLNPNLFEAHYFYARACFAVKKFEKAVELYEQASRVSPADYQAPCLLAFTLRCMGNEEKAVTVYRHTLSNVERHIELNPDDSRAFNIGAHALVELGETEKGLEWARRAASIDPDDPYIVYSLACVYARVGDIEEGLNCFETAIRSGFAHREWIENDIDLDPLRSHPRFQALLDALP